MRYLSLMLVGGTIVAALPASASSITIDSFTDSQFFSLDPPEVTPEVNTVPGAGIIGGSRTIVLDRVTGTGQESANIGAGIAEVSFGAADGATVLLIWDGNPSPTLDQNLGGGAGVDLTDGGSITALTFGIKSDLVAPGTVTFYSTAANSSNYSFNTPGAGFAVPFTPITISFAAAPSSTTGTGVDFTAVTAITFKVDATSSGALGTDLQLSGVTAIAPEPSTWVMMISGLALMIGGRKAMRRRA